MLLFRFVYSICIHSDLGKKTIVYTAKHGQSAEVIPIIGIDFEKLTINETPLMIWSIGGVRRRVLDENMSAMVSRETM